MMKKGKEMGVSIFGDRDRITSERYFVILTTFVSAVFSLILGLFHFLSALKAISVLLALTTAVFLFALYLVVRFTKYLQVPKAIFTVGCMVILDVTFYTKYLSNGPVLLFILIFAAVILLLWNGRSLVLLIMLYFLNLSILFHLDYNAPSFLFEYPSARQRSIDIYSSFFIYTTLLVSLLLIFKRDFLKQKREAVASDRLKSAFLANISHEIRTPMNGILGFSELLKNPNLQPEIQDKYIEIIETSGLRMLSIINDVIDISKIEAGLINIDVQSCNLLDTLEYIYRRFQAEAEIKGLRLVCEHLRQADPVKLQTDGNKLTDILSQLIKNAIKYGPKGEIAFGYKIKGRYIEFFVKDDGIGVAIEKQQVIFERFVQADIEDIQARQGAGLGLFIAKTYVELLGGRIWLESEPNVGSTFYFTLPYDRSK